MLCLIRCLFLSCDSLHRWHPECPAHVPDLACPPWVRTRGHKKDGPTTRRHHPGMDRSVQERVVSMFNNFCDYLDCIASRQLNTRTVLQTASCTRRLTKKTRAYVDQNPGQKDDTPILAGHTKIDRPYPGLSSVNVGWPSHADRD